MRLIAYALPPSIPYLDIHATVLGFMSGEGALKNLNLCGDMQVTREQHNADRAAAAVMLTTKTCADISGLIMDFTSETRHVYKNV